MLRNYFVTALRNFRNNRFYTLVNVFGLSIGITSCLVVYCIMKHELTFDNWHADNDRIYRVVEHYQADWGMNYGGIVPNAMPSAIDNEIGDQFESVITMFRISSALFEYRDDVQYKAFEESYVAYANSAFLEELSFPILRGAGAEALDDPYKVFLTERTATKYFGTDNPIGKVIDMNEHHSMTVVGVLANTPTNTNLPFDILVSFPSVTKVNGSYAESWDSYWQSAVYVKLAEGSTITDKELAINQMKEKHMEKERSDRTQYVLQPLSEVHTDEKYGDGVNYVAPTEIIIGFILLASITLIASILNFVNLATAQAVKRSKEIGIRKTLGSSRAQLTVQFLSETLIIVLMSTFLAFTFGQFFITRMNEFLTIVAFEISYDQSTVLFSLLLAVVVTVLAGFYPAMILSGYNPITALHNQVAIARGSGKLTLRKALVIGQFVIANLLIICTIIVTAQMSFVKKKDLGFTSKNVLLFDIPTKYKDKIPVLQNELENLNFVKQTSLQMGAPQADHNWNTGYKVGDIEQTDDLNTNLKFIDKNYLDLYDIPLLYGRNIENDYSTDTTRNLLVNRELLRRVNIEPADAIGLPMTFMGSHRGTIVGVVEDFHNWDLNSKLGPVLMMHNPGNSNQLGIRVEGENHQMQIAEMERVFRGHVPEGYFSISILDHSIEESYMVEELVHGVFQIFASMAILIALLGLYGLVSFIANQKRKSISIRKVFGASRGVILGMFGKEYVILMIIAFIVASPLSYFLSEEWLNGFEYRIPITGSYFLIAFVAILVVTVVTIGAKSLQAAQANPIEALRNE